MNQYFVTGPGTVVSIPSLYLVFSQLLAANTVELSDQISFIAGQIQFLRFKVWAENSVADRIRRQRPDPATPRVFPVLRLHLAQ